MAMTGLWTNNRDTLVAAIRPWCRTAAAAQSAARTLIDSGVVRVLDPDNTELVAKLTAAIGSPSLARAVIEALRQP